MKSYFWWILNYLCGLMIEAANSDGNIDIEEIEKIKKSLTKYFGRKKWSSNI